MPKNKLISRLEAAHPGWPVYDQLIAYVSSLEFKSEYAIPVPYISCGSKLVFEDVDDSEIWPTWLPAYVPALCGMNAFGSEWRDGYGSFDPDPVKRGNVYSYPEADDRAQGFEPFKVPKYTYAFQQNECGATIFINPATTVLYPNSDLNCFSVLDDLDNFTITCIKQTLKGERWFKAYDSMIKSYLID